MKDLLLKPDHSVNWNFILVVLLGSFITSLLYLVAEISIYHTQDYLIPLERLRMILASKISFFSVLWLWAWLGFKKPLLNHRLANAMVVGFLAGLFSEIIRFPMFFIIERRDFSDPFKKTDLIISAICTVQWLLCITLCEVFDTKFKNKVWLYVSMFAITGMLLAPFFDFQNISSFNWNTLLRPIVSIGVMGIITAILLRLSRIKFFYPETTEIQIRHFIVSKLESGRKWSEIRNELMERHPVSQQRLDRIFTTVSNQPNDFKKWRAEQCYLITYTLLSWILLTPFLLRYQLYGADLDGWQLFRLFMVLLFILKLCFIYGYLYHRPWAYKLTIPIALLVGILSILQSYMMREWLSAADGMLHLLAAILAYRISVNVFPNYRLFYKPMRIS